MYWMQNYYRLLGVENFASFEECATAYKKKHVELFSSDSPLANIPKLKELKDAFDLFADDEKKAEYDNKLEKFLEKVDVDFSNAVELLNEGKYKEAIKGILSCLKQNPGEPDYFETLGLAYRLIEDYDSSIKCFQQGLQVGIRPGFFHRYLGEIYRLKHDEERAETHFLDAAEEFKRILEIDPRNVESMEQLADIYSRMNWFEESLDIYRQLIKRYPYQASYHREVGAVLYELELYEESEKHLLEALRMIPGDSSSLLYLGLVYFKRRLLGMAVQTLQDSLKSNPDQTEVKQLIVQIETIRGEIGKTVEEMIYDPCPDAVVEGSVKWYNNETGIGTLTCPEYPEVLLHYSAIKPEDQELLKKGDPVRFGVVKDKMSPIAVSVERLAVSSESDTMPGKILRFDSDKKVGIIKSFDGKEILFPFSALSEELMNCLEEGLDVLFETKSIVGLSDAPVEKAVRVRLRKKRPSS